jgi:hypothetical protein
MKDVLGFSSWIENRIEEMEESKSNEELTTQIEVSKKVNGLVSENIDAQSVFNIINS